MKEEQITGKDKDQKLKDKVTQNSIAFYKLMCVKTNFTSKGQKKKKY